jgi:hypothetical protein
MSRRLVPAAFAAVLCGLALSATPASALPPGCDDPSEPGCEPVERTDTATRKLTVQVPIGTVTASGLNCTASTCSTQVSVSRDCLDNDCAPWPSATGWTLTASNGPGGYSPKFSDCSGLGNCTVFLGDEESGGEFKTVSLAWIDTTAPSVTFAPPAKVGPSNYNVAAGGSDNSGSIAAYAWTVDNVAQGATGSVLSLAGLANGNHQVGVRSRDAAGNFSSTVTKTVTVDKAVNVTASALPAVTHAATVPLTFGKDADVVKSECSFDNGGYATCASGWSGISAATADGSHSYRVRVTDDVGNVAESPVLTTVVDRTLPVLAFTDGPAEGQQVVTRTASITFALTETHPGALTCTLDEGTPAACSPGTPVQLSDLADGTHTLTVRATDTAGNTRAITRTFGVKVPVATGGETTTGGGQTTTGGGETPAGGGQTPTGGGGVPSGPAAPAFAPRFTHNFVYKGKTTTFTSLAITGLPKTAKVAVKCKGSGCAGKSKALKHSGAKLNVLRALKTLKLKAGAVVIVTVRGDGGAQSVAKYLVRAGKGPAVTYRCAKAGGKLGACS